MIEQFMEKAAMYKRADIDAKYVNDMLSNPQRSKAFLKDMKGMHKQNPTRARAYMKDIVGMAPQGKRKGLEKDLKGTLGIF